MRKFRLIYPAKERNSCFVAKSPKNLPYTVRITSVLSSKADNNCNGKHIALEFLCMCNIPTEL
jgi:hypothetical protein